MNKQHLAAKIWESANEMRSKIEANEYKDYILGFVFYKFLSDKEIRFLKENDYTNEDIKNLTDNDEEQIKFIQKSIGYFIKYDDGLKKAENLMFQMYVMHCPHLIVILILVIKMCSKEFLILFKLA